MIIRAIPAGIDQWVAKRVTPPRSHGLHVSTVLTEMLKTINPDRYGRWGQNADRESDPMWEAGYLWEDVLAKALADRPMPNTYLLAPLELALDDIYGTPDRLILEAQPTDAPAPWRIIDEEVKFTWMSCRDLLVDPRKRPEALEDWKPNGLWEDLRFTYWMLQSKTYAAMLWLRRYRGRVNSYLDYSKAYIETPEGYPRDEPWPMMTPLIRLRTLFINGAYRGALAIPGAFEIEYTAAELEAWWTSFRDYAHKLRDAAADDSPTDDHLFGEPNA